MWVDGNLMEDTKLPQLVISQIFKNVHDIDVPKHTTRYGDFYLKFICHQSK